MQFAHVIRTSGVDLLKLLNDILDLAKIESNTVKLEMGTLSLADLRDTMVQIFEPVADAQHTQFSAELDDRLPATMTTDPHRLRQVLKNLMSNAFKFTERGEVRLRIELAAAGWNPANRRLSHADSVIALIVGDTGIGIKDELHSSVFEAFAQADGTTAREYGGTGLGLSISRNLVDQLGGEIVLDSAPGHGSTFTVYLPLELERQETSAVSPFLVDVVDPEPLRTRESTPGGEEFYAGSAAGSVVLIVDDDSRNIFALTALLERGKLSVVAAESGLDALEILEQRTDIDIVLMDIMMPGIDGYEAMRRIRNRPEHADLPIIAVTGKAAGGERARCLAAGASDYIPKPVDTAELLVALKAWLPSLSGAQQAAEQ